MSGSSRTGLVEWMPSKDLSTIVRLCEYFNRGRVYEIFWEYCNLTTDILREKQALCWLYYENGALSGFALGRHRDETFVFEEVWGPSDGISVELGQPSKRDKKTAHQFGKLVDSIKVKFPVMLRAATDNQFAHLIARMLRASWVNGLIIAERTLDRKFEFSVPYGYKLRMFRDGDQFDMSKIHREVFRKAFSSEGYYVWATAPNCHSILATCHNEPIGFIIAEKRRCGSLGDFTIAIQSTHQRKGVGSTLLKAALNAFVDMKVKRVIADYLLLNTSAHRFYQKHKFKPKRIYNYFLCQKT